MRLAVTIAPVALILTLAACQSGATGGRYETELRKLADDCEARGGILSPTSRQSGRPQEDNVCRITGEPSRTGRN